MKRLQPPPRNRDIDLTIEAPCSTSRDMIAMLRARPEAVIAVRFKGEVSKARWRVRSMLRYHFGEGAKQFQVSGVKDRKTLIVRREP